MQKIVWDYNDNQMEEEQIEVSFSTNGGEVHLGFLSENLKERSKERNASESVGVDGRIIQNVT